MVAGRGSACTAAAALPRSLPATEWLTAHRGQNADWFREALKDTGLRLCIPGLKSRSKAFRYNRFTKTFLACADLAALVFSRL